MCRKLSNPRHLIAKKNLAIVKNDFTDYVTIYSSYTFIKIMSSRAILQYLTSANFQPGRSNERVNFNSNQLHLFEIIKSVLYYKNGQASCSLSISTKI